MRLVAGLVRQVVHADSHFHAVHALPRQPHVQALRAGHAAIDVRVAIDVVERVVHASAPASSHRGRDGVVHGIHGLHVGANARNAGPIFAHRHRERRVLHDLRFGPRTVGIEREAINGLGPPAQVRFQPARTHAADVLDVGHLRRHHHVGLAEDGVADIVFEHADAQVGTRELAVIGEFQRVGDFRLQVRVGHLNGAGELRALEQLGNRREANAASGRQAQLRLGIQRPRQRQLGRGAIHFTLRVRQRRQAREELAAIEGAPALVAQTRGQRERFRQLPDILGIDRLHLRATADFLREAATNTRIRPVGKRISGVGQPVTVAVVTEGQLVRNAAGFRSPSSLHFESIPARAITQTQRARTRTLQRQVVRDVRGVLLVAEDAVSAGHHGAVPARGARGAQRQASLQVVFHAVGGAESARGNIEHQAIGRHAARPHRVATGIAQPGLVAVLGLVAPATHESVRRPTFRVVAGTHFHRGLLRVVNGPRVRAEHGAASTIRVGIEHHTGHRRSRTCHGGEGTRRIRRDGVKAHRMASGILSVGHQREPRAVLEAVAEITTELPATEGAALAVLVVAFAEYRRAGANPELFRRAGTYHHGGTNGVAGVQRRERPVDDIDAGHLFRRNHVPARRIEARQEVRHEIAVHQHQRTGRLGGRETASAHQRVAVADVALADGGVRYVFQRVFGVDEILRAQVFGGNSDDGGRHGGSLAAHLLAGDDQFIELLVGSDALGQRRDGTAGKRKSKNGADGRTQTTNGGHGKSTGHERSPNRCEAPGERVLASARVGPFSRAFQPQHVTQSITSHGRRRRTASQAENWTGGARLPKARGGPVVGWK